MDENGWPYIALADGSSWLSSQFRTDQKEQRKSLGRKMTPQQFADEIERTGEAVFSHTDFMEKFGGAVRSNDFWLDHVSELAKRGLFIGNATGRKFGPVEISRWPTQKAE